MALIAPLLFALVFGMVWAGLGHYRNLTLNQGAREAARFAATYATTDAGVTNAWLDDIAARARASTFGELGSAVAGQYLCVAYVGHAPFLGASTAIARRRVETAGVASHTAGACFDDGRGATERRVQVQARRESDFNVVFFSRVLTLEGSAVSMFEAVSPP